MTTAPSNGPAPEAPKKRRPSGPRVVKPKTAILLYKGNLDAIEIVFDPMEALDRKEQDNSWSYKRFTVPVGKPGPKAVPSA